MRVLIVTPLFPPQTGGCATYYRLLKDGLAERKEIETILVLTAAAFGSPLYSSKGKIAVLRIMLVPRVLSPLNAFVLALNYAVLLVAIPFLVWCFRIDIIQYHQQGVYRAMEILGSLAGAPRILDKRDIGERLPRSRAYDRMICASENILELAARRGVPAEKRVHIPVAFSPPIPISEVDLCVFLARLGIAKPYLLFLGDVIFYKGIFEFLEAFRTLRKQRPSLSLVVAGKNRQGKEFTRRVEVLQGANYLGEVDHDTALKLIQGSELLVLPSRKEGLSRVAMEAIALGRKCAIPAIVPEFLRECREFTMSYAGPRKLAVEISRILELPDVPKYSLKKHGIVHVTSATLRLFKEVLGQGELDIASEAAEENNISVQVQPQRGRQPCL